MSKDKRQLRAEAVERLEKLRRTDYSWDDVIEAMLAERDPRYTIVSQLIDLLSDDEQPETFHDDFYDCESTVDAGEQDSREKLETDILKWLHIDKGDVHDGFDIGRQSLRDRVFGYIDRQAAITKAEQREWWCDVVEDLGAERDELRRQVSELRELNDSLHARIEEAREALS